MSEFEELKMLIISSMKNVLNVEETAFYIGITADRVRHLAMERAIPSYKQGKRMFFKREEIEAYLTQNKTMSLEEIETKADNYVTN